MSPLKHASSLYSLSKINSKFEDLENIKTVVTNEGLVFNEFMTSGFSDVEFQKRLL